MAQYFHKQENSSHVKEKRKLFQCLNRNCIEQGKSSQSSLTPTTRSTADPVKIDREKCMFCQQMTYKKEKGTICVATFEFGKS